MFCPGCFIGGQLLSWWLFWSELAILLLWNCCLALLDEICCIGSFIWLFGQCCTCEIGKVIVSSNAKCAMFRWNYWHDWAMIPTWQGDYNGLNVVTIEFQVPIKKSQNVIKNAHLCIFDLI